MRGYIIAWALKTERAVFNHGPTGLCFLDAFVEWWGWFSSAHCGKSSCLFWSQLWSQQLQPLQCQFWHWINCSASERAGAAWELSHRNSSRVINPTLCLQQTTQQCLQSTAIQQSLQYQSYCFWMEMHERTLPTNPKIYFLGTKPKQNNLTTLKCFMSGGGVFFFSC